MSTKRQDILVSIKAILDGITLNGQRIFNSVVLGRVPPSGTENVPYPVCFVYSDRETRITEGIEAVIGQESWTWNVVIEIWAGDAIMESLLKEIHEAMFANYKFDNLAEYSERIGVDFLIIDPSTTITAMLVPYQIIYRHPIGVM